MNIYYWTNFYKRENSTKVPASGGTSASCTIKTPSSFWDMEIETSGIPKDANYFKIAAGVFITSYDAYYFVQDVVSVSNSITRFRLVLDRLGTYKGLIGASYQYVVRTNAPGSFNPMLTDPLNPPSTNVTIAKTSTSIKYGSNYDVFDLGSFRYLLSVVGATSTIDYAFNNGIAKTYILNGGSVAQIASQLCTSSFLQNLVNEFTNPMEAIVRMIALPVNMIGMNYHADPVFFGSHSTGIYANVLIDRVLISEVSLGLPTAMTGAQTYLNKSPYCRATIYLPFVGVCDIDVDAITGRGVNLRTIIDCYTGDITYSLKDSSTGSIFHTFAGKCGSDLPISSMQFSAAGVAAGIMTAVAGAAAQNPMMAASGLMAAIGSSESHSQVNGSFSSVIGGWQGTDAVVTLYKREPAHAIGDNTAEEGLPYEKRAYIGNLSGYVLCRNGNVDIPGSKADKEIVNGYLNSGFFYE